MTQARAAAATKLWYSETAREVSGWSAAALGDAGPRRTGDPGAVAATRRTGEPGEPSEPGEPREPVLDTLRPAVRAAAWAGTPDPASWADLAGLGLFRLAATQAASGLGPGRTALAAACGELGACGYDGGVLDTLTVAAALGGAAGQARLLAPVLDGAAKGAVVLGNRPGRPVTDPGPDGVLLVVGAYGDAATLDVVPAGAPGVTRQGRVAMSESLSTVRLGPGVISQPLGHPASEARALLAGDLLRRAAWLIGAGTACLPDTEQHPGSRRQIARRLTGLAVTGHALRGLLDAETDQAVSLPASAGLLAKAGRFARSAADAGLHLRGAAGMVAGSVAERAWRAVTLGIAAGPAPALLGRLAARAAGPGERSDRH